MNGMCGNGGCVELGMTFPPKPARSPDKHAWFGHLSKTHRFASMRKTQPPATITASLHRIRNAAAINSIEPSEMMALPTSLNINIQAPHPRPNYRKPLLRRKQSHRYATCKPCYSLRSTALHWFWMAVNCIPLINQFVVGFASRGESPWLCPSFQN